MNMFYLLADPEPLDICVGDVSMVWTIFGYVIFAIQVVVPLLLIISGMITMATAIMEKKEDKIKEAQNLLIKKLIAAVITFLIIAVVKIIVPLVSSKSWEACAYCAMHPFGKYEYTNKDGTKTTQKCGIIKEDIEVPDSIKSNN